jgi:hypothetical protein
MEEKEEPNYQQIIDDEYQFPIFSEDPTEQNRLNVRHALKKAQSGMQLSDADSKLLIDNGLDDFVRGGQTQAAGVDAALLAAPFLAKPAMIGGALTGTANLIKKYPMKSLEVGLTGLGAADYKDNPQDLVLETLGMKTDTMFTGGKTPSPFNPIATKKLASIIDDVFSQSPFAQTTDGINVPFFMSKSDNVGDGVKGFSKVTSPEYERIVLSGMERMGMKDGVFDLELYDLNSPILNEMTDPLGGAPMKSGQLRSKKLTKRNWLEYFLTPESLKGNFEALKKQGKVATTQTWEAFLKSKGLKTQAIQAHHINPLYDSVHLLDGVKWGSDEYWDIITTLIDRGARPGIVEREGMSNIIKTLGASARTDTPHGVAHEFYRDIVPTFFNKKNRDYMKLNHKNRMEMTKRWAGIVNRSENIVYEAHKAWEALNPQFRIDFDELVERMTKYTDQGVLEGVHENYQVPDIRLMVQKIQTEDFLDRLNIKPVKKKKLPALIDNELVDELNQEFLADLVSGKTKKELTAKWGKKYNLKAIGAKQLNFFDDIRDISNKYD